MSNQKMTIGEAEDILLMVYEAEDMQCFCHITTPCAKCENNFGEDEIAEAKKTYKEYYGEEYE